MSPLTAARPHTVGGGPALAVIASALSSGLAKSVAIISVVGQFFFGMACLTSASRRTYAFSRDGAVPGHRMWSKLNAKKTPTNAVIWIAICAVVFCLPFTPAAVPFNDDFTWAAVNYAPLVTGGTMLAVWLWWLISARHTFDGPRVNVTHPSGEPKSLAATVDLA